MRLVANSCARGRHGRSNSSIFVSTYRRGLCFSRCGSQLRRRLRQKAVAAGFEGIAYRSAQHYGQDCFVVFGASLKAKLVWRKALLLPNGSMHQALAAAIRGGQILLAP